MLKLNRPCFAQDENGDEVFMSTGDSISEIEDAGPVETIRYRDEYGYDAPQVTSWNVTCRFTPAHHSWSELVTVDSIKLLRALE